MEVGTTESELGAVAVKAPSPASEDDIVVDADEISPPELPPHCKLKIKVNIVLKYKGNLSICTISIYPIFYCLLDVKEGQKVNDIFAVKLLNLDHLGPITNIDVISGRRFNREAPG